MHANTAHNIRFMHTWVSYQCLSTKWDCNFFNFPFLNIFCFYFNFTDIVALLLNFLILISLYCHYLHDPSLLVGCVQVLRRSYSLTLSGGFSKNYHLEYMLWISNGRPWWMAFSWSHGMVVGTVGWKSG